MRIYDNFGEAYSEIRRDLVEMGIKVSPKTFQDQDVKGNPDFDTLELQNYIYTVTNADPKPLPYHREYVNAEVLDRAAGIDGDPVNPGESWKTRPEIWEEFLDENGRLAYTYSERFANYDQVQEVIKRLKEDPDSRQCYISIWSPSDIKNMGGQSRIPCSLGYQIQIRKGKLNLTYLQRSCDFATHYANDAAMASWLQMYLAHRTKTWPGTLTHWIGSLHIFRKDGEGIF